MRGKLFELVMKEVLAVGLRIIFLSNEREALQATPSKLLKYSAVRVIVPFEY